MLKKFEISESEFRLMRDFIHERYGIYFQKEKMNFFKMKLSERLISLGLNSFRDYYNIIRWDSDREKELFKMMSLITNNETYFFREFNQLKAFSNEILEELWKRKINTNSKKIRIVSAGCSTGEEVYSLAMLLFESGKFFGGWDIKISGVDISERAIEIAKSGKYYERSLRMTDTQYVKKYFSQDENSFLVPDYLKQMTRFIYGNIIDPKTWIEMQDTDIILCRNVLIYFSDEKFNLTINNLYNTLKPEGYLLLGHSETLNRTSHRFELVRFPGTLVYKKKGA